MAAAGRCPAGDPPLSQPAQPLPVDQLDTGELEGHHAFRGELQGLAKQQGALVLGAGSARQRAVTAGPQALPTASVSDVEAGEPCRRLSGYPLLAGASRRSPPALRYRWGS